jgi:hypothetical protein
MYEARSRSGLLRAVHPVPRQLVCLCLRAQRNPLSMASNRTDMREVKGVMPRRAIAWDPVA